MWAFIQPWIPSITVAAVIAVVGYAYRDFLLKWFAWKMNHHYYERLEKLKSDLRVSEQQIQNRLASNQRQMETLYGTILALSSGRQSAVDKRRLEAIEKIWKSAVLLSNASGALRFLEPLKFDKVLKASPSERAKIGEIYKVFDETVGASRLLENKELLLLQEERPFITASTWAYYSAFHSVISHGVLVMSLLSRNMFDPKFFNFDAVRDVIKKVLPHHAAGIDTHGITYCYKCTPELLEALLRAVQDDLEAKHQDAADLARAKSIMEAVQKAYASIDAVRESESKVVQ